MLALSSMSKSSCLFVLIMCLASSNGWALCVKVSKANLRAKPSAKSKLVWTVGKYMPLLEIKQKGSWIQVRGLEGKKMWIHGGLVSTRLDCAVVKVSKTNLRKGPGTRFGKTLLQSARRYMPFRKIERDGAWLRLQDDYGYKHWVFEKSLWEPLAYSSLSY